MKKLTFSFLILSLLFILTLAACGESQDKVVDAVPSGEEAAEAVMEPEEAVLSEEEPAPAEAEAPSLSALREQIDTADCLLGVAYLGVLSEGGQQAYNELIQAHYLDAYPFLAELDWEKAAINSGMEIYAVVPRDIGSHVVVSTWVLDDSNEYQGEPGETLYESRTGEPVILMGNESDIMPNLLVTVTTPDGATLSYSPSLSLRDGALERSTSPEIYDFSIYTGAGVPEEEEETPQPIAPEEYLGDWAADGVTDGEGDAYSCCLTFREDGGMEFFYYALPGQILERFDGTYVRNDDGSLTFTLPLTGGFYLDQGAPDNTLEGTFRLDAPDDNVLYITHLKGDPLLAGLEGASLPFVRAVG